MDIISEYEIDINHEFQKRNKKIWKGVFCEKSISLDDLESNEIYDGWRRSADYGLDPLKSNVDHVLSSKELLKHQGKQAFFLDVSRPMLEHINQLVHNAGFSVAISDANGIIITVLGDTGVVDDTRKGNWLPGADWSEKSIGNNVIGSAIELDKPIFINGYEHYCHWCHNFASASAPIHYADGELLGVIALCGRYEKIHSHTLGLVVAAAKAIEIQLELNESLIEKENANDYQELIFNSMSDAILSTDINEKIEFCNQRCCELLEVEKEKLIGQDISTVLSENSYFVISNSDDTVENSTIVFQIGSKQIKCIGNIQRVSNTRQFDGIVLAFNGYNEAMVKAKEIVRNKPKWLFDTLVGKNSDFQEMLRISSLASKSNSNIFIFGESGTGKDVLAQAIHNESDRYNEPFVAINCGAIPKDLIGSELFGYSDGAFTGAKVGGKAGIFENAGKGTVFLDEIGEMPMDQQVVLLRVIDDGFFNRIGSTERIPFEARIVSATNKKIEQAVLDGDFRQDLYYRLNVFPIVTVPLRDRMEDIEDLANSFLKRLAKNAGKTMTPISQEVLSLLLDYNWPGNIRELQNILERAYIISSYGVITKDNISINMKENEPQISRPVSEPKISEDMITRKNAIQKDL